MVVTVRRAGVAVTVAVEVTGDELDGVADLTVETVVLGTGVQRVRGYPEHSQAERDEQDEPGHHARPQRHGGSGWHGRASFTGITVLPEPQQ
jgi:hypothetical protein